MKKPSPRRRRRYAAAVILLAAALAMALAKGLRNARWRGFAPSRGTVRRVIDGDTFDLTNGARVRLLDVDAPEFDASERERALAQLATDALVELIGLPADGLKGREVRLEYGPRVRDRYDRFLAYCFVDPAEGEEGRPTFVNIELVRRGLARAYLGGRHGSMYDAILAAEGEAREAGRGMWAVSR
jgi:micrococcal nuclease